MTDLAYLDDIPLERTCEYCGQAVEGRADKRFCDKVCGINFEREDTRLRSFAECLYESLAQKIEAKAMGDIEELREAQLSIQRRACSMLEVLERRATLNPTVERAVLLFWKNAILAELFDLNETSSGYPTYQDQLDAFALSELTNPFGNDGEDFD